MIEIIPAIDIIDGKCVRLSRGDYDTSKVYSDSPADMARRFADAGVRRIHLVDLDGAKAGKPCNLKVLSEIRKAVSVALEWGGGLKKEDHLDMSFECGADCVVCGSVAVKEPLKLVKWLREFGGEKVILGADLRDGKAATAGWTEDSSVTADSLVERFMKNGLSQAIVTDISKDGMLQGPSDQLYVQLQEKFPTVIFTVSGGISSMDDIRRLDALGLRRVIVGKAIYENRISMEDIALWSQKG